MFSSKGTRIIQILLVFLLRISLAVGGKMEAPLDRSVLRRRLTDLWAGGKAPARGSFLDALVRRWGAAKKAERHEGA